MDATSAHRRLWLSGANVGSGNHTTEPSTRRRYQYGPKTMIRSTRLGLILVLAATWMLLASACTNSGDSAEGDEPGEPISTDRDDGRFYSAQWTVDAEAIGKPGVGFPYPFVEIVDDLQGTYLYRTPNHLAYQDRERVVFCAGVTLVDSDPRCASTPRPDGTPDVIGLGLQRIRDWHPLNVYEVADFRRLQLVADEDPEGWSQQQITFETFEGPIQVDCFLTRTDTETAPTGVELCFTKDENRLLASVDLNGDLVYEVQLDRYRPFADEDEFAVIDDLPIVQDPRRYEQLIVIFPEIPIPPTPTPEPVIVGDDETP